MSEKSKDSKNVEAVKPVVTEPKKESSGDKHFDDAIDRLLKKPVYVTPVK